MIIDSSVSNRGMGIFMAFEADSTTPPIIVNSSVGRTREYLTGTEVEGSWPRPPNRAGTGTAMRP